jgi:hypothetical protein
MDLSSLYKYGFFLKWLGLISAITFVVSILLIPWLIKHLPPDYFTRPKVDSRIKKSGHPILTFFLTLARNIFGVFFLLAGIAMLFLPGQGILTILLGISMIDFPGKDRLVRSLIIRPSIRQALNWIRDKTDSPPFRWQNDTYDD